MNNTTKFKGTMSDPWRVHMLMRSTLIILKSLAQLFQIMSESSGNCFDLFGLHLSSESLSCFFFFFFLQLTIFECHRV